MRIHITIFNYQREELLKALVQEIKAFNNYEITYTIIDDGSDFIYPDPNFVQFEHGGKPKFYEKWDYALRQLPDIKADMYIFTPSDYKNLDIESMVKRHIQFNHQPYAYNIINDGRTNCWNLVRPISIDECTLKIGFIDCGFFCNRECLIKLGYYINSINPLRFANNEAISSGVGQQITQRMRKANIQMYLPKKSYADHGEHPSLMHPEERLKNPLKSI